ncbi:MAG: PEP/pyruvate-binding domain-containing protein [Fibrobacteria bacterium]
MKKGSILWLPLGCALAFPFLACDHASSVAPKSWECAVDAGNAPDFSRTIGCRDDFSALASIPLDATVPGTMSLKTVVDLADGGALYFQDSKQFKVHYAFASARLSGNGKPAVPSLYLFNQSEYYTPGRRFILGAVTRYEGPGIWAYEIAPYDNASAEMIHTAFTKIADACYCGDSLYFHPTSMAVEAEAKKLPASVKLISTDKLFEGIDYQPLNYATGMGRLVFTTAKNLETQYLGFRDIVVIDAVPNDISVTSGIITQEFQTPLSHINVLSQNRGIPNMGLHGAVSNPNLLALKGKWVKLTVGANAYSVTEVTQAEADAWWEAHKPKAVSIAHMDTTAKEMLAMGDILDLKLGLGEALKKAIPAYGGKASNYGTFPHMDSTQIKFHKAVAIPVYYYWQHMQTHGFNDSVDKWLADPLFTGNPGERDKRLKSLRKAIIAAPLDSAFAAALMKRVRDEFPGINRIRFRSSTNAEDLEGFTGAGLYESHTGDPDDPSDHVFDALKDVWSGVWFFRSFEERAYRSIDHKSVGMAVLVHAAFPEEEANGVASTANPFDPTGLEPGFYVNTQAGGKEEVVAPSAGVSTDVFIYHYDMPGQPIVFITHSSLVPKGKTVLTGAQTHMLGMALKEIQKYYQPLYGKDASKWWAMEVDFKLDQPIGDPNGSPVILIKQARPYPGFGQQ